jgi:HPt (histidine-containing phosphotransfer) domain-containing protein
MNRETGKDNVTGADNLTPADLNPEAVENLKDLEKMGVKGAFRELSEAFLREMPDRIELLREKVVRRDLKIVARNAHDIKNSSGMLGADTLSEISHLFEQQAIKGNLEEVTVLLDSVVKEYVRAEAAILRELEKEKE